MYPYVVYYLVSLSVTVVQQTFWVGKGCVRHTAGSMEHMSPTTLHSDERSELEELRAMFRRPPVNSRSLRGLGVDEVCLLLKSMGLATQYASAFRALGMSGADLAESSDADLRAAGVTFGPHRKRLLTQVSDLDTNGVPTSLLSAQSATATPEAAEGSSARDSKQRVGHMAVADALVGTEFWFVDATFLRTTDLHQLPKFQDLRHDHPECLSKRSLSMGDVCARSLVSERTDPTNAIDEFTAVNREHWMRTLVNPL